VDHALATESKVMEFVAQRAQKSLDQISAIFDTVDASIAGGRSARH
jgi:hypothetical protein